MDKLPAPGEGKRGEAGYLGYLLRQASVAYRTRLDRALSDIGVTAPQFTVLTMLRAYPGLSNADLARLSLLTPQTVNVIVANLLRAGAVTRSRHAAHGRIRPLALTAHGQDLLAAARKRARLPEAGLAVGLTAEEERVIRRWLALVARAMTPE